MMTNKTQERCNMDKIEQAWTDYTFDKMIDPVSRYTSTERDAFAAGWKASQKRNHPAFRESVWISAPVLPDEDPE